MSVRLDRFLCLLGAVLWLLLTLVLTWRWVGFGAAYLERPVLSAGGLAMGFFLVSRSRGGWLLRTCRTLSVLGLMLGATLVAAELGCRLLKLDFNELLGVRQRQAAFPIYFQMPRHPSGTVFFTRPPEATWTGQPLTRLLELNRSTDVDYTDEVEVTIAYDDQGFRRVPDQTDWDVVVAGDSFTEAGYLPEEKIFTGQLAARSGLRVRNLGISDTGTFSHAHYLEAYGAAPSARQAVLAFFEGNDLQDNAREAEDLRRWQEQGVKPDREIHPEPSLLRTLYHAVRDFSKLRLRPRSFANADFTDAQGRQIPLTIADAPPAAAEIPAEQAAALREGLDQWVARCQAAHLEPSLLYLPCKRRVLHGLMTPRGDYPQPEWELGDLPAHLESLCVERGIKFIDATPALRALAERGILPFNAIFDTHFNEAGHAEVGRLLAQELVPPESGVILARP
ncbi:MAG: SGNH/GDSL hydrolase family protein [Verrucomicrobiales bacterium]|nr:SGNH/GDSL hydrolase family protein [Verrucomicrobiales bacterium]